MSFFIGICMVVCMRISLMSQKALATKQHPTHSSNTLLLPLSLSLTHFYLVFSLFLFLFIFYSCFQILPISLSHSLFFSLNTSFSFSFSLFFLSGYNCCHCLRMFCIISHRKWNLTRKNNNSVQQWNRENEKDGWEKGGGDEGGGRERKS